MSADLRSEIKRAIWWCRFHRMQRNPGAIQVQTQILRELWKRKQQEAGND